jgi:hypothetical protein
MRIWHLVTLAALVAPRDSAAQQLSGMVQAIPVVTRADPTATRSALDEGYLTQPAAMGHVMWKQLQGIATLNFEGLTLKRGELTTGGYGEGYVDRRHPHSYVHELLAGVEGARSGVSASLFAGRGFAPFGSDDPMVRPFEKYPVNHHLAQILERVVAIGAVRAGPVIGEFGVFNGDEPISPGSSPNFDRFADSWSSRVTVLPVEGAELSASIARVASPEVRVGHGLDQHKASAVARFDRLTNDTWHYALVEWAHTNEMTRGITTTRLGSVLGEGAYCRAGTIVAGRIEHTDRPEEEPLADPFRTPRPSTDLSNLGVSRWTTFTVSLSSPPVRTGVLSARPFVEVERVHVSPGTPAGIFDAVLRYGSSSMWMLTAGIRLHAGMMHDRMGRYGVALPAMAMGTAGRAAASDSMPGMPMPTAMPMSHSAADSRCAM